MIIDAAETIVGLESALTATETTTETENGTETGDANATVSVIVATRNVVTATGIVIVKIETTGRRDGGEMKTMRLMTAASGSAKTTVLTLLFLLHLLRLAFLLRLHLWAAALAVAVIGPENQTADMETGLLGRPVIPETNSTKEPVHVVGARANQPSSWKDQRSSTLFT